MRKKGEAEVQLQQSWERPLPGGDDHDDKRVLAQSHVSVCLEQEPHRGILLPAGDEGPPSSGVDASRGRSPDQEIGPMLISWLFRNPNCRLSSLQAPTLETRRGPC
ncbi:hypothetical protein H920_03318 [Fukomys damarensis]|uniref:Uncharacterized protein n=1 Tax=Fukomys damarensis TaxID=885580 RepID=A0A091DXK4_FUKDA|nr:hypothetical protein H920_03318 [Fukomys damarensis]